MRTLDWFFTESTDSQQAFCPLPLEPENHSQALLQYLTDRKTVKNEGDTSPTPYIFTVNDVRFLLINRFDLTTLDYLVHDVQYNDYEKLYNIAYVNQLPLTTLHGLQVNFSKQNAMRHLDDLVDDFISDKTPIFFGHMIIGLRELKHMANNPKYHFFFSHNDLQLTISYCNSEKFTRQATTIHAQKFHDAIALLSCENEKTTAIKRIQYLATAILNIENPSSADLSKGALLLFALICAFNLPSESVSTLFWETQMTKAPLTNEQPCRESDIALLSKIRNY